MVYIILEGINIATSYGAEENTDLEKLSFRRQSFREQSKVDFEEKIVLNPDNSYDKVITLSNFEIKNVSLWE